jgi:hypothetical protein
LRKISALKRSSRIRIVSSPFRLSGTWHPRLWMTACLAPEKLRFFYPKELTYEAAVPV